MENNTTYEHTEEIDLVALFFTLLHKYRQLFAGAVICAVLLGAAGAVKSTLNERAIEKSLAEGKEVPRSSAEQKYEEEMVTYRKSLTEHDTKVNQYNAQLKQNEKDRVRTEFDIQTAQEYMDGSVLNGLDPYNVHTATASFYVTTEYKILPGMDYQNPDYTSAVLSSYSNLLTEHQTIGALAEKFGLEERYMRELISVSVNNTTRLLEINVMADSADKAKAIMDEMLVHLDAVCNSIEQTVGTYTLTLISQSEDVTVMTWLRDAQQSNRDNMLDLQNKLVNLNESKKLLEQNIVTADKDFAALKKPEEPSKGNPIIKFSILGVLLGIVVVSGVEVVRFLVAGKVYSSSELHRSCGLSILGSLAGERSQKAKGLDVYINRMEKRPDGSTDAQIIELIATTIQSRVPQAENILISGDLSVEQLTSLTASLQHTSALGNKNLTAAESILSCAKTVSQATTADVIVLVADCENTTYASIQAQCEQFNSLNKKILGCVVYE